MTTKDVAVINDLIDEVEELKEKLIALTKEHDNLVKGKKPYKPKGHKIIKSMLNNCGLTISFRSEKTTKERKKQKHFLKWIEENYPHLKWRNGGEKPTEYANFRHANVGIDDNEYLVLNFFPIKEIKFKYKDFPLKEELK